ncbi:hypothetical protein [Flavobacterium chilense]|uniref:Uncharacterized protein n=1 Tax=Flavobacterium chilense TaxID=946677 RepID=A0A1M7N0U2_9FLAO|nr:hypothetical protein [Flavobacterium chilense]SHM96994.1 hypothetical protein SAMN05444484_11713 [Flavobacterium chilense]
MKKIVLLISLLVSQIIFSQNTFPGTGNVYFDTSLKIGKQEAPASSIGEINRLSLQPYGHTGGPWNFKTRDDTTLAFLDIDYGITGSALTITSDKNIGIGTTNPQAKLDVNGSIQTGGGANNFYGFGPSSPSKPIDVRSGSHYPYVFNWHEGLTFSAHSGYGGIRFYNQGYPDMFGTGVMVMSITNNNVGIGTTNPTSKLTVAGNIASREVKVTVDAGADFVFENDYPLPPLESVDKFIKENKHLPEVASAKEMQKNGINLSEMNIKLLQKIEELTLYTIDQNEKIKELERQNKKLDNIEKRLKKIENASK